MDLHSALFQQTGTLFLSCFSVACAYYAWKKLKKIRVLQDTPTSKVRAAAQGYIQLAGRGEHIPLTVQNATFELQ